MRRPATAPDGMEAYFSDTETGTRIKTKLFQNIAQQTFLALLGLTSDINVNFNININFNNFLWNILFDLAI